MPTPAGLPKVGEVWELRKRIPGKPVVPHRVVIIERSAGSYWSVRVGWKEQGKWQRRLWVDASYHFQQQEFKYVAPAGDNVLRELGLPPAKPREHRRAAKPAIVTVLRGVPDDLAPGRSYDVAISDDSGWQGDQYHIVLDFEGEHDPNKVTAFTIDVGEKK